MDKFIWKINLINNVYWNIQRHFIVTQLFWFMTNIYFFSFPIVVYNAITHYFRVVCDDFANKRNNDVLSTQLKLSEGLSTENHYDLRRKPSLCLLKRKDIRVEILRVESVVNIFIDVSQWIRDYVIFLWNVFPPIFWQYL